MTELAIIIVNFNTRAHLEACLQSIHDSNLSVRHEIIVVDNASTDGSVEAVRLNWPSVRVIAINENLGYARANNLAIRSTNSELILLLNGDTIISKGSIDGLVQELRMNPDIAIVGPQLVDGSGKVELSFGHMISPLNEARQKLLNLALTSNIPLLSNYMTRIVIKRHSPDWISGACLLVRRSDTEAAGLLDERFFLYGEDVDFCCSVRQLGRRLLFVPEIKIIHYRGRSGVIAPSATHAAYRRSQLTFYAKHHPAWLPILRLYLSAKNAFQKHKH